MKRCGGYAKNVVSNGKHQYQEELVEIKPTARFVQEKKAQRKGQKQR